MKYMGSKRWMLGNGLGELLDYRAPKSARFIDLFSGSSAVASFVATRHKVSVVAADLQTYSRVLSAAVIERTEVLIAEEIWAKWLYRATTLLKTVRSIPDTSNVTGKLVEEARKWCANRQKWTLTRAYGGHYFSPKQALWLDALRCTLPSQKQHKAAALAALIDTAAYCAASPGHTAQPFQPTKTAKRYLQEAWDRDVCRHAEVALKAIALRHAKVLGSAVVADAVMLAKTLRANDLVFIDPPYSGVHYSRFYHVLETVATGRCEEVSGVGRYQDSKFRPRSDFSMKTTSSAALDNLLKEISDHGAEAIITFPEHECSNGLSGSIVEATASKYFSVERKVVSSRFSTLGGTSGASATGSERAARQAAKELILYLREK